MKVQVFEMDTLSADELHIYCYQQDAQIVKVQQFAERIGTTIQGKKDHQTIFLEPEAIYYIESVDRKTFAYTASEAVECSLRLYEAEAMLEMLSFVRATKSSLINLQHIKKVVPQINRNLMITLNNNEKVEMSRRYVRAFREKLGME